MICNLRGEGMVFGLECAPIGKLTANETAIEFVKTCYLGHPGGDGIHFLGALAGKVLRVSPPMTMTEQEAHDSLALLYELVSAMAARHR